MVHQEPKVFCSNVLNSESLLVFSDSVTEIPETVRIHIEFFRFGVIEEHFVLDHVQEVNEPRKRKRESFALLFDPIESLA